MLDIDYLENPRPWDGPIVYRYRNGVHRYVMQKKIEDVLLCNDNKTLSGFDPGDLERNAVSTLYDQFIPFCDWIDGEQKDSKGQPIDRQTFAHQTVSMLTGTRVVVFARFDSQFFNCPSWALLEAESLVIDEVIADSASIPHLIAYLDRASGLATGGRLASQPTFIQYFRNFVGRSAISFSEFVCLYNEAVLLYADLKTASFAGDAALAANQPRNYIHHPLRSLIFSGDERQLSPLLQALSRRYGSDDDGRWLLEDLCHRTVRWLGDSTSYPGGIGAESAKRGLNLILWSVVLLAWSDRLLDREIGTEQFGYHPRLTMTVAHHMFHDFLPKRQDHRDLTRADLKWRPENIRTMSIEARSLMEALRDRLDRDDQLPPWCAILGEELSRTLHAARALEENRTLPMHTMPDHLVGFEPVQAYLNNRLQAANNSKPILLIGPSGAGKRTAAKYYAMALSCRSRLSDGSPCRDCQSCQSISRNSSFDFACLEIREKIDAGRASLSDEILRQFKEFVRGVNKTLVDTHQSIFLSNIDREPRLADLFLKVLEVPSQKRTWILGVEDINNLNPAIASRCDYLMIMPLTDQAACQLASESSPHDRSAEANLMIVLASQGWPGRVKALVSKCDTGGAIVLDDVREILGFNWAKDVLKLCEDLLSGEHPGKQSLETHALLAGLKRVLIEVRSLNAGCKCQEPAFVGLMQGVDRIDQLIDAHARRTGRSWHETWGQIWIACDQTLVPESSIDLITALQRRFNV